MTSVEGAWGIMQPLMVHRAITPGKSLVASVHAISPRSILQMDVKSEVILNRLNERP